MKIIDISWPIKNDTTTYKNKNTLKIKHTKTFSKDKARESQITISTHTGTHIDAPSHFLKTGKTIDKLDLNKINSKCRVIHIKNKNTITVEDLKNKKIKKDEIILLKTKNSNLKQNTKFNKNFTYLTKEAAKFLTKSKIKAIGIDYLGIERDQPSHETHKILLKNNIPIIEGLRLKNTKEKTYQLICLPLNLIGLEAAPARAILIEK